MTDGPVRVMPREALNAVPSFNPGHSRFVLLPDTATAAEYTDAEFAAHFVPADAYERLIAAVEMLGRCPEPILTDDLDKKTVGPAIKEVLAAYRAYVGSDL